MIPQPVLAAFYATAIAIIDTLLVCFGPVGRLPNRHVRVTSHLSVNVLTLTNANRVQTLTVKQTMKS